MVADPHSITAPGFFADQSMSTAGGIDHVAIAVHDPDKVAEWYRRSFGMVVVNDEIVHEDINVRLVFLAPVARANGSTLQLISPISAGPVAEHLREHGEGLHHLCLAAPDISGTLTRLGESPSQIFNGGYGLPCAFLRNNAPGGVRLELVERTSPPESVPLSDPVTS